MPNTLMFDISKWVAKAKGNTRQFASEFIQDLNEAVVVATPVKTGFLRGSWYATIEAGDGPPPQSSDEKKAGQLDPSGGATVSQMNLVGAQIKLGDKFHAQNGANYAYFVEYGTSRMAPRAFVRSTMERIPEIAEAAAKRVAGGA